MKVLSLMQPWASLLVMGIKKIETRTWTTTFRGELLIHASKSTAGKIFIKTPSISQHLDSFASLPLGAIIGQATLKDIIRVNSIPVQETDVILEENAFGDQQKAKYHWVFEAAILFDEAIPATGKQGLWEW